MDSVDEVMLNLAKKFAVRKNRHRHLARGKKCDQVGGDLLPRSYIGVRVEISRKKGRKSSQRIYKFAWCYLFMSFINVYDLPSDKLLAINTQSKKFKQGTDHCSLLFVKNIFCSCNLPTPNNNTRSVKLIARITKRSSRGRLFWNIIIIYNDISFVCTFSYK